MTKDATLSAVKLKKAPDAPRRFKSAYIFFSIQKHKEIRANLPNTVTTTDVAKLVSQAWKSLSVDERSVWEEMSDLDKMRYEEEKSMYNGPWKVSTKQKRKEKLKLGKSVKDRDMAVSALKVDNGPAIPPAPKRPASAFLSYSNARRATVKAENPHLRRGEISKLLSRMWAEAPEDVRKKYRDQELVLREEYKPKIKEWRRKAASIRNAWREKREMAALEAIENRQRQEVEALQQRMGIHSSGLQKVDDSSTIAHNHEARCCNDKEEQEKEQATKHPSQETIMAHGSHDTEPTHGCHFENVQDSKEQLPGIPGSLACEWHIAPDFQQSKLSNTQGDASDPFYFDEALSFPAPYDRYEQSVQNNHQVQECTMSSLMDVTSPQPWKPENTGWLLADEPVKNSHQVQENFMLPLMDVTSKTRHTGWSLEENGNDCTPQTDVYELVELVEAAIAAAEACED